MGFNQRAFPSDLQKRLTFTWQQSACDVCNGGNSRSNIKVDLAEDSQTNLLRVDFPLDKYHLP